MKGNLSVGDGEMIKYMYDDAKTLYEAFQRGKRLSSETNLICVWYYYYYCSDDGPCLGTRASATGPYQWLSYSQVL